MNQITQLLCEKISANRQKIDKFFAEKFSQNPPLFYNSVDLRHAGYKLAPVDTNCFPAGFNNLGDESKILATKIAEEFLAKNFPTAKKILLIPESHTRNLRYLINVKNLSEILAKNCEVKIGTLIEEIKSETPLDLENGDFITIHPLQKNGDKITTKDGFSPDLIILNHDLTDGIPEIFHNISTPISPSPMLGWHSRSKSKHFDIYNQLSQEISQILQIDPWLISSIHKTCHNVDFKERKGIECLAKSVEELLENIGKKYQEFGIDDKPYCYVKADSGTYGMAVWAVFSSEEILTINKKERNKMNMLKGAVQNTHVMIQEGIKTLDKIDEKIAEPMIYLINGQVVGDLFRVNETRDEKISLNASGANFFDLKNLNENQLQLGATKNQISEVYSLISRLAALAAAIENQQILASDAKS